MIDITIGIIFYSFVAVFTIWFSFKQIKNGLKKNQTSTIIKGSLLLMVVAILTIASYNLAKSFILIYST
ncbi:hypothetical protein CPZ30_06545 [Paenibacillus lautus]|nr:hypothetical protein CPZ30_06545 [Paenibacillus lautus]